MDIWVCVLVEGTFFGVAKGNRKITMLGGGGVREKKKKERKTAIYRPFTGCVTWFVRVMHKGAEHCERQSATFGATPIRRVK